VDIRLEVVVLPVSDLDRAKEFYVGLGWRLDTDFVDGDDFRVVQPTPPRSPCSITRSSSARESPRQHPARPTGCTSS
jgi:catechol 2,3-dioxygenase-like lactoylglutathione lyase family enzyme